MTKSVEEKRAALTELAEKAEARVNEYTARAETYRLKAQTAEGDKAEKLQKKARAASRTVRRQTAIAANHRRTIEGLEDNARRAERASRVGEVSAMKRGRAVAAMNVIQERAKAAVQVDRLQTYNGCLQHAAELDAEVERHTKLAASYRRAGDAALAEKAQRIATERQGWADDARLAAQDEAALARDEGRDLRRERAVALKAVDRQQSKAKTEERRLADLKLETNLGTAAAQREYVAGGARKNRVVSMAEYATLFRRTEDRTPERIGAMRRFDNLCGTADSGLIPEPRFEHESGSGKGPGALVMENRAAGLEELADLTDAIGAGVVRLLRLRVYERRSLTAIVREGIGTEATIAALFLSAVEAARVFWSTRSRLEARLAAQMAHIKPERRAAAST